MDKKACVFFFLMSVIFVDFGNQIRKISYFYPDFNSPLFSINHINNTGSAFSLFQNHSEILSYFGVIAYILLFYYVFKCVKFKDKVELLSITLSAAGILGNAIERFNFNHVVDYIKLNFIDFPIFNCFDIMICTGCFLYIAFMLSDFKKTSENDNKNR